jgi:hypothetical protein
MCGTFSAWSHGPVKGLLLTLALVTGMWLIAHNCESSWSLVQLLVDLTYSGKKHAYTEHLQTLHSPSDTLWQLFA